MADDFQTGICSGSWWNSARSSGGYEAAGMPPAASSMSCSTSISVDEPVGSASGSTITFQDTHKPHVPNQMVGGSLMDSTMQIPNFGLDWTQAILRSSGRAETSFHAMLQDDLSSRPYFRQEASIDSDHANHDSSMNLFKDMNQPFSLDQHQQLAFSNEHGGDSSINNNFSYGCSTSVLQLQGLLEPDTKPQQSIYDNRPGNYQSQMIGYRGGSSDLQQAPWPKFPQFLKASPPKQQPTNQLHFSNNTPFWNASAGAMSDFRSGFQSSIAPQFAKQTSEQKPNCSNLNIKLNSEGSRDSSSSTTTRKSSGGETAFKKPRIETPSPLPTFKVRKEKLGDRITALQQLVSPFGKTDTASVLHEAIEYIKFLHEQVSVLSTPYMKNGHPMQQQQLNSEKSSKDGEGPKQDLKSRGLCLVPIASTYPVASETPPDFWTPTFGGTYR